MKKNVMSNLSTNLCKTALSMALHSVSISTDGCTFLLYEPKQPENLKKTDIKGLIKTIKSL